jgi:hypothetical protein
VKKVGVLVVAMAALVGGTAFAAGPRPKPLPVTATFELSSTDRVTYGATPVVLIKIARADRCRTSAPSPVTIRIGSGVYVRANACNPYFVAPQSWTNNGVTTLLFGPYRILPRGWVAFDPFWSLVFKTTGTERIATFDWHSTDPRTKTWDVPISVVSCGKVVASAVFQAGYTITGDVVPGRRIFDDQVDDFINVCINGTYTLRSLNGHLYCDVPEGFWNVRTALSLVRK